MTIDKRITTAEKALEKRFKELDTIAYFNTNKVLNAFIKNRVDNTHFSGTTGYGYANIGRDTLNQVFADAFEAKDAFVSTSMPSATTALYHALMAILRPGDLMLAISGKPYDTLDEVIKGECGGGSFKDYNIKYEQIDLIGSEFDEKKILDSIKKLKPKFIHIQRSRGYSARKSLLISQIENIISKIRTVDKGVIIMVDNCYGEFTEAKEPTAVGADLIVGSLIKNAGGTLAPTGAHFTGTKKIIELISKRVNSVGLGGEVGSNEAGYRLFFQGFFIAPRVVKDAMKAAYLFAEVLRGLGKNAKPTIDTQLSDIVCSVEFGNKEEMIKFCQAIQKSSPIDSYVTPIEWEMPGYSDQVIMAGGSFVSGATIELSVDGPIRPPYIAYLQGAITYEHAVVTLNNYINHNI
ncbi:MAG: methionine gamma-lyase family protein [Firmicutes bacterium]|nr:methionine gamma-lyase family protein [Bacillota bacterium]